MAFDPNSPVDQNAAAIIINGAGLVNELTDVLDKLEAYRREYGYLNIAAWVTGVLNSDYIPDTAVQGTHVTAAITAVDALFTTLKANTDTHWKSLVTFSERGK